MTQTGAGSLGHVSISPVPGLEVITELDPPVAGYGLVGQTTVPEKPPLEAMLYDPEPETMRGVAVQVPLDPALGMPPVAHLGVEPPSVWVLEHLRHVGQVFGSIGTEPESRRWARCGGHGR